MTRGFEDVAAPFIRGAGQGLCGLMISRDPSPVAVETRRSNARN
ncbi:hypothetical protein SAMN05518801_101397 [Novosphingobium sp. CF614]|nr:hypothetical protein SAMN05518801_101397 [Novosphingobium sp. CF614]